MGFQNEVEQLPDEPRSALRYGSKGVIVVPGNISASFLAMKRVLMKRAPVVWRICTGMAKKKGNQEEWAKRAEMVTLSSVLSLLYSKNSQANAWQTTMGVFYYALGIQKMDWIRSMSWGLGRGATEFEVYSILASANQALQFSLTQQLAYEIHSKAAQDFIRRPH